MDVLLGAVLCAVWYIVEGVVGRLLPRRLPGWVVAAWWVASVPAIWGAVAWFYSDPSSDLRRGIAMAVSLGFPAIGLAHLVRSVREPSASWLSRPDA